VLRDQIPNAMIPVNPLSLTITYVRVDRHRRARPQRLRVRLPGRASPTAENTGGKLAHVEKRLRTRDTSWRDG
jgi:hypothetical protein